MYILNFNHQILNRLALNIYNFYGFFYDTQRNAPDEKTRVNIKCKNELQPPPTPLWRGTEGRLTPQLQ